MEDEVVDTKEFAQIQKKRDREKAMRMRRTTEIAEPPDRRRSIMHFVFIKQNKYFKVYNPSCSNLNPIKTPHPDLSRVMQMIHVFGHRNPDTDAICSAIGYAYLLRQKGKEAKAFRLGEINAETKLVLERFGVEVPEMLESAAGKDVWLMDHNEFEQSADGIEEANIVGVIDHHKIKFSYDKPITYIALPWGSSSTIVAKLFEIEGIEIPRDIAGCLLSAILSDTVIFKSPTTTDVDREMAEKLARIAGIDDLKAWGIELFKAKSKIREKSAREIVLNDYKVYDFADKKFLINQVEVIDDSDVLARKEEILEEMRKVKEEQGLFAVLTMVTDIMKEGTTLLVVADDVSPIERAFGKKVEENAIWLPGVMSRKKQIVPPLEKTLQ
ncbi:MAG: manganese-dependent inorganic pyrophosphatase [Candidatus Diapherotrites archaeon]|nr:manganese-dependent inorganic pyrophosphatase [Candidatus Diapherotrites archaeon]MDN5366910.1 manganese-dependent inorganic pyrophosphatase [Candidatus Diapherotrites archaeon]